VISACEIGKVLGIAELCEIIGNNKNIPQVLLDISSMFHSIGVDNIGRWQDDKKNIGRLWVAAEGIHSRVNIPIHVTNHNVLAPGTVRNHDAVFAECLRYCGRSDLWTSLEYSASLIIVFHLNS
jgi:hypothetical protein